ncbi:hypothetical protein [Shimia haliotis]|uniref:Uncharacterized protein n=1 Tax=Shimia haliotis TaxID=1280847 RepID=A0A1I4HAW2_9RHOB|nr:hypothetical protein [Shimia haliotis]SFL39419.1 hypothetical protein SAMN04488036_11217 [Shimia haliotis]
MTQVNFEELVQTGDRLIAEIATSEGKQRYQLHQDLHRVIENIRMHGDRVPRRFRDIDLELLEEEIEDQFDNMPV